MAVIYFFGTVALTEMLIVWWVVGSIASVTTNPPVPATISVFPLLLGVGALSGMRMTSVFSSTTAVVRVLIVMAVSFPCADWWLAVGSWQLAERRDRGVLPRSPSPVALLVTGDRHGFAVIAGHDGLVSRIPL